MAHSAKILFIAVLLALLTAAQVKAQDQKMYRWTDENGVVHFSDVQPEDKQVEEQLIPMDEPPAASDPYAPAVATGPSVADQKRQQIAAGREQAKISQEMNAAQCSSWKAEVARLEPNRRVFTTNEQGETERMDDVVRTDRVAELKSMIAKNCN